MWDYRVIKTVDEVTKEEFLDIHEVYYNNIGKPTARSLANASGESVEQIRNSLNQMLLALDKPILRAKDFK